MHRCVRQYIIHIAYLLHVAMEGNSKGLIYQNSTEYFNQSINIKHQMCKKTHGLNYILKIKIQIKILV